MVESAHNLIPGLPREDKEVLNMLGEQIGEETGQITGMRVLPDEGAGPKVEVSFQASGTLLGAPGNDIGTYVSVTRPDGTLFGDGQGVIMTDQGEAVAWRGQGVGRFTGHGTAVSWRGAIYFQTAAERLARLNGVAGVFEFESDESGKTASKTYEWK
jgi:hypothetical protein